jgi:hypothetical protein
MKKFMKRTLLGSSLALVTMAPVIAAVTETATLNVTSNVQQTIAIYVKDAGSNVLASGINGTDTPGTLDFGNVDGFGFRTGLLGTGVGSVVGLNTGGVPENPGTGSTSLASALYIYGGHSTSVPGINILIRIQGASSTAVVTATQPNIATDEQKVYLGKHNITWAVGGGWTAGDANHPLLNATPTVLGGPGAFTNYGALSDGNSIPLDLALQVMPSNTVGARTTVTKFFAAGY